MKPAIKVCFWLLPGALALGCSLVRAQTSDPTALASTLSRLAQSSADYRKSVPDFTCVENVVSTERSKGEVKFRSEFRANIRVVRMPDGSLEESFTTTEYMGAPVTSNASLRVPLYIHGGLSRGAPIFFAEDQQRCFRYDLQQGRLDYQAQPIDGGCGSPASTHGFATLDDEGKPLHLETRRSVEDSVRHNMATFSVIDYKPVQIGGNTFRLPVHLYSELADHDHARTFEAYYTGCRLFKATVTIHDPNSVDPQ